MTRSRTLLGVVALALVAGCKPVAAVPPPPVPSSSPAPQPSATPSPKPSPKPTASPSAADGLTTGMFRSAVPAIPKTVSVKAWGAVRQNARVGGRDGGQSALVAGKSVWVFNDTTFKDPWGFVANTAAATTDLDASDGIDLRSSNGFTVDNRSTPTETLRRTAAELAFQKAHAAADCRGSRDRYCGVTFAFWPGPVFADTARHRVLFTYGKLCRGGQEGTPCSGPLGKGLGLGLASLDMSTGDVTRLRAPDRYGVPSVEGHDPTLVFGPDENGNGAGASLVVGPDVYLYTHCDYFSCGLMKAPLNKVADKSAYTYWNGSSFGKDANAIERFNAQPGAAGNSVFYNPALKSFVDVYMPYGSNQIFARFGGSPMGPWSEARKLLDVPGDTKTPNYAMYAHTEYAEKGGLVQYLSYFDARTSEQRLVRWEMSKN